MTSSQLDSLQLSGMTLRARGRRSSKEASNTTERISGYDITAQLAKKGNKKYKGAENEAQGQTES